MFPNKIPVLISAGLLSGFAFVGLFVFVPMTYALTLCELNPIWVTKLVFVLFALGSSVGAGILYVVIRKIERDVNEDKVLKGMRLDR